MTTWQPLLGVPELCAGQPWLAGRMAPVLPTDGLAIASLVCGVTGILLSVLFCGIGVVLSVSAVICGHLGLSRIERSEIPVVGRGMAITGLITGYLGLLCGLAAIAFLAFALFSASAGVGP